MPGDWITVAGLKSLGAAAGSGIAVLFRPGRDGILRLLFRWAAGLFVGYTGAGATVDFFHLEHTDDIVLFSASALGILGYSIVQIVLGPEFREALANRIKGAAK